MKNSALWRVVDNESGTESIVSTPSEAVAFVNSRFDTDDEPFSITEVGPLLPKPLGVITVWAAEKDGEQTDGRTTPILIKPVVLDSAIDCDDVVLWGDVYVSWNHDMYTVEGPDGSEYSEAYSAAELSEILDEYADCYEYVPEEADSHTLPNPRELIRYGARECTDRFGHLDDDALLWLAATRITLALWRNTPVENWHAGKSPLHDGTMMRINAATTRIVRSMLSFDHVDWIAVGLAIVDPSRVLPTGQSVLELGLACHNPDDPAHSADPREDLAEMAQDAIAWGRTYRLREKEFGLRTLIEFFCAFDNGWFGSPSWGRIVDRFLKAVDDRENAHWRLHRDEPWFEKWFTNRPADIANTTEFRRLLHAGPDLLSEEAAEWCVEGAIRYVCQDDHAHGCLRCGLPPATESTNG
ncbi:hypothetical protein RB625_17970 [Streptomyces californicus]|uniref:hypothetical protein n=1 Tax=Streptomyces californicus TaxID=67351 RepID=UPI00296E84A4|nr:hypothetical protein [Streptomyces californicus]MDW4900301.1 hypothetical protein [Streptomyces californicus]